MSPAAKPKRKRSKERIFMRLEAHNGRKVFVAADRYAAEQLRAKGYAVGDVVSAEITKLNNPKFHRLLHHIGTLCAANIPAFHGMDAHKVLKRIQLEGNIACEEMAIVMPGVGMVTVKLPTSLSFENMDDGERHEVARAMCRHISLQYWPDLSPEKIEQMAESWVEET